MTNTNETIENIHESIRLTSTESADRHIDVKLVQSRQGPVAWVSTETPERGISATIKVPTSATAPFIDALRQAEDGELVSIKVPGPKEVTFSPREKCITVEQSWGPKGQRRRFFVDLDLPLLNELVDTLAEMEERGKHIPPLAISTKPAGKPSNRFDRGSQATGDTQAILGKLDELIRLLDQRLPAPSEVIPEPQEEEPASVPA